MQQYLEFLQQLFLDGQIELGGLHEPSPAEIAEGFQFAEAFEREYRRDLAGRPPVFSPEPFSWAALNFYRAAQFILFRDVDAETVNAGLNQAEKPQYTHSAIYSIDLIFRFLPDLLAFARREGHDDPVELKIEQWLSEWPLSNAGAPTEPFSNHPTLCRLYVDRWMSKFGSRLALDEVSDDIIRQKILADWGQFESQLSNSKQEKI